ncbi:MAG TPA: hypothetical protein VMZ71_05190, partial [Gemmataceae bacterium]|nr:hypothetical protein [Gemmataceae bacterium]
MTALLVLILTLSVRPADAQLTTAESVRISFRNAAGPPRPVRLENVVVTCVSAGFKHFFVQDKTGGVQVRVPENLWPKNLVVGDVVSVTGVADNNLFRAVTAAKVERAGRQEKLKPAVFDLTPTHANVLDGMLVATRGTVRNKQVIDGLTTLTLSRPGGEVKVVFAGGLPPDIAVGATIDVQGVCATDFGRDRRVQVPTRIVVSDSTPPVLNAAAPPSLFDTKPVALKTVTELAAYLGERRHLVRLTGVLTARAGGKVFVQDAKGGVPVVLVAGQTSLTHGTLVDVVGAPAKIDGMYGLENSQIRQSADGTPVPPVAPVAVPLGDLAGDAYLARLVRVEGTVIDVSFSLGRMRLSVFDRGQFAEAFLDAPRASDGVVPGSRVALVGVCDADGAGGVVLRLRADDDVELLRGPPFWTGDRV